MHVQFLFIKLLKCLTYKKISFQWLMLRQYNFLMDVLYYLPVLNSNVLSFYLSYLQTIKAYQPFFSQQNHNQKIFFLQYAFNKKSLKIFLQNLNEQLMSNPYNLQNHKKNQSSDSYQQKLMLESDESEGSDISYQSSIDSGDDIDVGKIDYFKQQMARFFINYPQLLNQGIIDKEDSQNNENKDFWKPIAQQILHEAQQPAISLESLAKRIAKYRVKLEQPDLIDRIIENHESILGDIEIQANLRKYEKNDNIGLGLFSNKQNVENVNGLKNSLGNNGNVYYSWWKKKQVEIKNTLRSNSSPKNYKHKSMSTKYAKDSQYVKDQASKIRKGTSIERYSASKRKFPANQNSLNNFENKKNTIFINSQTVKKNEAGSTIIQQQTQPAYMANRVPIAFQPKTEAGKQLCQQISKCNQNDQLAMKKTIVNFVMKHRQKIQKQILTKNALSQKINKLYSEDSKQLVLFYPIKRNEQGDTSEMNTTINGNLGNNGNVDIDDLIDLLKNISQGPLMKYWKQIQEKKI